MKREMRLTKRHEYQDLQRRGRRWSNRFVVLQAAPNRLERSRWGFTVSKRLGTAVARNTVKRRLREIARSTPVKPGWDMVVIARRDAAAATFRQLHDALSEALRRASLLDVEGGDGGE